MSKAWFQVGDCTVCIPQELLVVQAQFCICVAWSLWGDVHAPLITYWQGLNTTAGPDEERLHAPSTDCLFMLLTEAATWVHAQWEHEI